VRVDFAARSGFVLAVCVVTHTALSIDRGLMAILQEPIKRDLLLSDTQLGLLSGLGFAMFFGIAGLPMGWLVDRYNRRNILSAAVLVFSGMTALGAAVATFAQLLITRSIVGAGEAAGGPAMGSMLADQYPPAKRSSALSIYYLGAPLGSLLAFLIGGWVAAHYGWRSVLLLAGLPGVAVGILIRLFVTEPKRQRDAGGAVQEAPPFRIAVGFIWSQRSLRHALFTPVHTCSHQRRIDGYPDLRRVLLRPPAWAGSGRSGAASCGVLRRRRSDWSRGRRPHRGPADHARPTLGGLVVRGREPPGSRRGGADDVVSGPALRRRRDGAARAMHKFDLRSPFRVGSVAGVNGPDERDIDLDLLPNELSVWRGQRAPDRGRHQRSLDAALRGRVVALGNPVDDSALYLGCRALLAGIAHAFTGFGPRNVSRLNFNAARTANDTYFACYANRPI